MDWRIEYKKKQFEIAKKELGDRVKNLHDHFTPESLLEFYCLSCNFGYRFSTMVSSHDLKKIFSEALNEQSK